MQTFLTGNIFISFFQDLKADACAKQDFLFGKGNCCDCNTNNYFEYILTFPYVNETRWVYPVFGTGMI